MVSPSSICISINKDETLISVDDQVLYFRNKNAFIEEHLTYKQMHFIIDHISHQIEEKYDTMNDKIFTGYNLITG